MKNAFEKYHPAVNFVFFIGAIVFGMFFVHPAFLLISVVASSLYYILLKGRDGIRSLGRMWVLFVGISVLNPLFNTQGATVLFRWIQGRPFTLEALGYGVATGGMFLSILLWFSCYNAVMTSDKFIYMFGRMIPTISLILSMVLRLVPEFQKKISTISGARRCIGKGAGDGDRKEKIMHGMDILSTLTSWALEDAAITADAMKSRGYGSGVRTSFHIYRKEKRDIIVSMIMGLAIVLIIISMAGGGTKIQYYPIIQIPDGNQFLYVGMIGYALFLFLPSIIQMGEDITWYILKSKI